MTAPSPGAAAPLQLYVYYKVPAAALGPVLAAARGLQAGLRARWPGLQCALLRRPELRDGQVTVMEAYAGVLPPDFEAQLAAAVAVTPALAPPLARAVERFVPVD